MRSGDESFEGDERDDGYQQRRRQFALTIDFPRFPSFANHEQVWARKNK
jgi:hypothetical protein